MHEVSVRAASNRMDAHNLAIVLCPNLVKGSNPMRDVTMCSVANAVFAPSPSSPDPSSSSATLGIVIKLCIERYYEVFDEVLDRSEAVLPRRPYQDSNRSEASASPTPAHDDESIDDAMLVMPIGPSGHRTGPPSAWGTINGNGNGNGSGGIRPQHRSHLSGGSVHGEGRTRSGSIGGRDNVYLSAGRSKSMVNIENGTGTVGGRGSITLGRGTVRKSSGAGVEAIGITAEGFFTPPSNAPPVPPKDGNGYKPSRD